jgi:hypothetical protein
MWIVEAFVGEGKDRYIQSSGNELHLIFPITSCAISYGLCSRRRYCEIEPVDLKFQRGVNLNFLVVTSHPRTKKPAPGTPPIK